MARLIKTPQQMLTNHIVMDSGCHAYIGDKGPMCHARPKTTEKGVRVSIARRIYSLVIGPIPDGMVIRHKCDNGWCVNPIHLEIGTCADNSQDMVIRNRQARGSKNSQSKLNESIVAAIRAEWIPRINSVAKLSEKYKISKTNIDRILHGHRWSHVEGVRYEPRGMQCAYGHKYTSETTRVRKSGRIDCLVCIKERQTSEIYLKKQRERKKLNYHKNKALIDREGRP